MRVELFDDCQLLLEKVLDDVAHGDIIGEADLLADAYKLATATIAWVVDKTKDDDEDEESRRTTTDEILHTWPKASSSRLAIGSDRNQRHPSRTKMKFFAVGHSFPAESKISRSSSSSSSRRVRKTTKQEEREYIITDV